MMSAPLPFTLTAPDLGAWRAGNTGTEGVWRFDSGTPGRHVMISALVHGNELCGAWALKGLLEAGLRPARGTLTLALCNLAAFDRFDPHHHDAARFVDEDLNRQWVDARMDAGDTLERRRAAALRPFVAEADWLLDLHSMHEPCAPLLLTGMQPRNLHLARTLAAPEHIVVDAGHKDGTRMRDYGRFGQPDAEFFAGRPGFQDTGLGVALSGIPHDADFAQFGIHLVGDPYRAPDRLKGSDPDQMGRVLIGFWPGDADSRAVWIGHSAEDMDDATVRIRLGHRLQGERAGGQHKVIRAAG